MDFLLCLIDGTIRAVVRLIVIVAVFSTVVVGLIVMVTKSLPPAATAATTAEATPAVVPELPPIMRVKLLGFSFERGGFGSVAVISFKVENRNSYAVKDVTIDCSFYGASGTEISHDSRTIFSRIGPQKILQTARISFARIDQQAHSAGCRVLGVERDT